MNSLVGQVTRGRTKDLAMHSCWDQREVGRRLSLPCCPTNWQSLSAVFLYVLTAALGKVSHCLPAVSKEYEEGMGQRSTSEWSRCGVVCCGVRLMR